MNETAHTSLAHLRGPILRDVSRSFYLSLRILPAELRDPISLAYLLARATDTIADTAEIDAGVRLERLGELAALIQRDPSGADVNSLQSFAALQKNGAERTLIEKLPDCLRWLQSLAPDDRDSIRSVLARINEGQASDIERFDNPSQLATLETAAELDRYTYLVAGSVGEFWTESCFRHLAHFSAQPKEAMLRWGIDYGKGLQLVNILRDAGADLRAGRCYLPAQELGEVGVSAADLQRDPMRAEPVLRAWRERAEEGIASGIEYACAIEPWRVRFATVLPALIGARTLALLREAGTKVFERRIKVERAEVRRIMFALVGRLASPAKIRTLYANLSS